MNKAKQVRVRQRTPEWHAFRREHIGSSDAPAIAGESPYTSALAIYAEKVGEPAPIDPASARLMMIGQMMEPVILDFYADETGRKVRKGRVLEDRTIPWLAASLDGEAEGRIVEAKFTTTRRFNDGVPPDVLVQVTHQMAVAGAEVADVAVFTGRDFLIHEVPFDPAFWDGIYTLEAAFWQRLVDRDPPPPDASDSSRKALAGLYPVDTGEMIQADPEMAALVRLILDGKDRLKFISTELDGWENALRYLIGPRTGIEGPGFHVTYRKAKDSQRIGWAEYAGALERLLPPDKAGEAQEIKSIYTYTQEGSRRLLVNRESQG